MPTDTKSGARGRATDALERVALEYGTSDNLATLARAGDGWQIEAIAQLAEAVAALLLDVTPRRGTVRRRAR